MVLVTVVAPPPLDTWPGPVLLSSEDLLARHGFDSGDLLRHHAQWRCRQLGLDDDHPYVDSRELLGELVRRTLLPRLHQRQSQRLRCDLRQRNGNHVRIALTEGEQLDHVAVFAEEEIVDIAGDLYPRLRPCDYQMVDALSRKGLPYRPALELFTGEEPSIVSLAAENVESLIVESNDDEIVSSRAVTRESLTLAALACS